MEIGFKRSQITWITYWLRTHTMTTFFTAILSYQSVSIDSHSMARCNKTFHEFAYHKKKSENIKPERYYPRIAV